MTPPTKDQSIETLRGIAIILVVSGYIITGDLDSSHSAVASALNFGYYLLKPIRMPLFTVISAYLYAASPATRETFKKLAHGKTRRILIPFFFVSAIQYTFFWYFHVDGWRPLHEILGIYVVPFEQFWFLWAVFWILMVVGALDAVKALETKGQWLGWLVLSMVCHIAFEPTRTFAIHGINYLFPFFLMGYGIRRFAKELFSPAMVRWYITISFFTYFFYASLYNKFSYGDSLYKAIALMISFSIVPLIFYYRVTVPWLSQVGYYAFGIHIFNKISSAWPRMLFERLHIESTTLEFLVYLGCGIVLSIAVQIALERFSLTRRCILGMKDAPPPLNIKLGKPFGLACTMGDEELIGRG